MYRSYILLKLKIGVSSNRKALTLSLDLAKHMLALGLVTSGRCSRDYILIALK